MPDRRRSLDIAIPFALVGSTALAARVLLSLGVQPAIYLVPSILALLTGLARPSLLGSAGAWVGWTLGIAIGWWVGGEFVGFAGPAIYGLMTAAAPHSVASLLMLRLRERRAAGAT